MSVLAKFSTGFALKENGRTIYIIPNSLDEREFLPLDLIVLETSETVGPKPSRRKLYEAYKIHVTQNSLENAFELVDIGTAVEILKDAIGGSKLSTLELLHEDDGTCLKVSYQERNASKIEGSLCLEKIELVPSVGSMLEAVVMNLMKTAQENTALRAGARDLNLKQEKLEALFQELVHEKSKLQDRWVRAFREVLNTKKRRIRELEKEITALKKRREDLSSDHCPSALKRKRKARSSEIISSSESETEVFSDRDEDITDYDAETDVHESDEDGSETRISNVNTVTSSSDSVAPETPSTSTCKKNLFSDVCKKTEKAAGRKFPGKCPPNLFGSQSDSSQEINKLPEPGPSEVSKDEMLGPSSKAPATFDDEDTETQFIPVANLENAEKKTELGAAEAELPVNREPAGGNDEKWKKLFGIIDSQ